MAAAARIVSLNLGSQTVGLADFRTQPNGGLVLVLGNHPTGFGRSPLERGFGFFLRAETRSTPATTAAAPKH